MKRSQISPLPVYFERYILLADDVTVHEALEVSLDEIVVLDLESYRVIGDQVYAPGKWTLKDIWQHLMDTERVFAYRATAFARGQFEVTGFEQDEYVELAKASRRTWQSIHAEAIALRQSTIHFYHSLDDEMLNRVGKSFAGTYSVRDLGFFIAGHQRWHELIIRERYYPLIGLQE